MFLVGYFFIKFSCVISILRVRTPFPARDICYFYIPQEIYVNPPNHFDEKQMLIPIINATAVGFAATQSELPSLVRNLSN